MFTGTYIQASAYIAKAWYDLVTSNGANVAGSMADLVTALTKMGLGTVATQMHAGIVQGLADNKVG